MHDDKTNERICSLAQGFVRRVRAISPETGCVVGLAYADCEGTASGPCVRFGPIVEGAFGTQWSVIAALVGVIVTTAESLSRPALNKDHPFITDNMDSVMQCSRLVEGCLRGYVQGALDKDTAVAITAIMHGILTAVSEEVDEHGV